MNRQVIQEGQASVQAERQTRKQQKKEQTVSNGDQTKALKAQRSATGSRDDMGADQGGEVKKMTSRGRTITAPQSFNE